MESRWVVWEASQIERILGRLRELDPDLRRFGATGHRYQVGPRLTESEIDTFEERHHIVLPDDYRSFLRDVGNGGAGPYYGLYSLERAVRLEEEGFLARPFPYTAQWNSTTTPILRGSSNAHLLDADGAITEEEYFEDYRIQGTLTLAHEGCGYYQLLVVSGAERGHVWADARASDGGILPMPYEAEDTRITFREWYEDWLEKSIREALERTQPRV